MAKKIAIIGARGINNYGGFETIVGEIAPALVKKGFDVYCSCEKNDYNPEYYCGAKLIYFPIKMSSNYIFRKLLELLYDIYFNIYCTIILKCDTVYSLGVGANIFVLVPRMFGKKSIVNIDGLEWRRDKFNKFESGTVKLFFYMVLIGSNLVIVDSDALKTYINPKYLDKVIYIPYGVGEVEEVPWEQNNLDVEINQNDYWLVVARLEPENNIDVILNAYIESKSRKPLVVVGNFVSENYEFYIKKIAKNNDKMNKIIFMGGIYDPEKLNMLRQNCFAYIHGHSVGGTNPSLLEAMVMKNIIIAHENEFNREVCNDSVLYFRDFQDLKNKIDFIEENPIKYDGFKQKCYLQVKNKYSWDKIVEEYSKLL